LLLHSSYLSLGVPNGLVIHHAQGQSEATFTWSISYFSGAVAGERRRIISLVNLAPARHAVNTIVIIY
jgi:hypothetical protein